MKLSSNVLIVEGTSKVALYNFNNNCIYRMSFDTLEKIRKILKNEYDHNLLYVSEIKEYLIRERIIVPIQELENIKIHPISPKISFAWIEITQLCNLKCIHCYEGSKIPVSMSKIDFFHIIDQLSQFGIKKIQITGGEPLIHPDLLEMLNYCKGKFDYIEIYTNATLVNEAFLNQIKSINVHIAFTKLSDIESEYESVTSVLGSFKMYTKGIHLIRQSGIHYRIGSIKTNNITVNGSDDVDKSDFPRLTGNATLDLYSDEMLREKLITPEKFTKRFDPDLVLINRSYNMCFGSCIYIDVELNVYPCPMERRVKHGTLSKDRLNNILKKEIMMLSKDKVIGCKECEYRYACIDCRPDSNGSDIYSKPWYCTYDPVSGHWTDVDEYIKQLRKENI